MAPEPIAAPHHDSAREILELLELELAAMIRQLERAANSVASGAQSTASTLSSIRHRADALAGRATLGEQLRAQQAQAEAEGARFNLSDLRYRNGVASYLDLLDAQRALFSARQAVVQTRLLQLQNQVTLYKALGGGWKD